MRRFSRPISIGLTVVIVLAVFSFIDSVAAARVEHRISRSVEENSRLATQPEVFVGGVPFAQVLVTHKVPQINVNALDVDIRDLGIVNAATQIYNVDIPASQAYEGEVVGHVAELMKRTVSLDGVAMGQLLDMTDLDIANPYDISPAGGVASEAQLTGTLPGMEEESSVVVSLRLRGTTFRMEPTVILEAAGDEEAVRRGYTLEFDTRELPLAGQASMVQAAGGSIMFEAERRNVKLKPSDLSPVETGDSELTDYAGAHD